MSIDFELDETVAMVRDFVHTFAEATLRPLAREADEKGELPPRRSSSSAARR